MAVSVAVVATQVPRYMDSLNQRIVFAHPNCMDVVGDSAAALSLTTQQRTDSLMPWTRDCMEARQRRMLEHADTVGWRTTLGLLLLAVFNLAVTLAWAWERLRTRLE